MLYILHYYFAIHYGHRRYICLANKNTKSDKRPS